MMRSVDFSKILESGMSMRILASAIGLGALLVGCFAAAAPAVSGSDAGGLEEVVVTAQRREESAQSVGIAMTVLSGASLADKAISNVNDLQNAIPSLQVEPAFGSSQPQYRLRGVGFIDYTSNNPSPVGVSVDEVAYAFPIQTEGQLFDLDRVEVLRGPQGTLYGRNTTGGVVNFVTNRPTEDLHAGVTADYGSHNEIDAEGYVSGSIAPGLLGRLSIATEEGGAWQRDRVTGLELGKKNKVAGRGQLEWNPSDAINLRFTVHLAQDKSDEVGLHLLKAYTSANGGLPGAVSIPADTSRYVTGWSLNPAFASVLGIPGASEPGLDNTNNGADLNANIDLGFAKLTSITAFNKLIRRELTDWDATQFHDSDEYLRSDADVLSQELRLASNGTGAFGWLGGVYYSKEHFDERFYSDLSDRLYFAPYGILLTKYTQDADSLGVFGQVSYAFTDQWKATLGVREDHEKRELSDFTTGSITYDIPAFAGAPQDRVTTSNLPSGKAEIDYQLNAASLFYGSVSRGVKSGGFTAHNTGAAAAVDPFKPEKLTAFELGIKSDVLPTLRLNAAGFFYKYRDEQVLTTLLDPGSGTEIGIFTNVNSRISGGELEAIWRPLAGLSISQYAGFAEGYYTSPITNSAGVQFNGQPLSFPKWSYGGDASYSLNVTDYKVTAETNFSFHDTYSQFFLLTSNDFTIPKYWLANANLSLSPATGAPWTVTLWGRNIFNRSYDVTRNFFLASSEVAQAGEPATFGIRVSYKY